MARFHGPRSAIRLVLVLAAVPCLFAQAPPSAPKEPQGPTGLPPRTTPVDYQVVEKAGKFTIAAEFTGHGIPNSGEALNSEEYVAVEVGLFGPAGERLTITASDFSLKINARKAPYPSMPWGLVAKEIKDPSWAPPEPPEGSKSKGGISGGGGGQEAGAPPPPKPKPPIELLRNWQQRLMKAALLEGDRALPQAGLLFFQYRGKRESIKSVELIYQGPAGNATLTLQ
jgi:hypothetical protein